MIEITNQEWTFFDKVCSFLGPFKEVTNICSGQYYPTFTTVLPLYYVLLEHCTESEEQFKLLRESVERKRGNWRQQPSLETCDDLINAATFARIKLDSYYNVQSDYAVVAVVLDPRLNVGFFEVDTNTGEQNRMARENALKDVLFYYESTGYKPNDEICQPESQSQATSSLGSKIFKKQKVAFTPGECQV